MELETSSIIKTHFAQEITIVVRPLVNITIDYGKNRRIIHENRCKTN